MRGGWLTEPVVHCPDGQLGQTGGAIMGREADSVPVGRPRVVIAPDKFKGSLSADAVAAALAAGIRRGRPDAEIWEIPIADGGDGTIAAAVAAGFDHVPVTASGPTGHPINTGYARRGDTAVIELAAVSGLSLLPAGELAPLTADTRGVGELISAALDDGCRTLVLGLGGSASTDGGSGLVSALGARLSDTAGSELPPGGGALASLARLDLTRLDPRLREVEFVVASDVDNPLLGDNGAAAVYGPQKGAAPAEVRALDAALSRWAAAVAAETGADHAGDRGAGAAGGTGFAALALLGATFRPGIEVILELSEFQESLAGASLVITGEGSLDEQTLHGKGPAGIATIATAHGITVLGVAGQVRLTPEILARHGFSRVYPLSDLEPDTGRSITNAAVLLEHTGEIIAADWL